VPRVAEGIRVVVGVLVAVCQGLQGVAGRLER
jgi:hypothetical protein